MALSDIVVLMCVGSVVLSSPLIPATKSVVPVTKVPSSAPNGCRPANEVFDETLRLANADFLENGNLFVPVEGFEQSVYLSYLGSILFVKFYLKTSGGSLRLSTAARAAENATICYTGSDDTRNGPSETLIGVLDFGQMELKYDKLHAEYFKSSNLDGQLVYRVRPVVNLTVKKSPEGCRLDALNFVDTTRGLLYEVTSDSWKDWAVAKIISRSLRDGGDSTPILQHVLNNVKKSVESNFVKIWCQKDGGKMVFVR